MSGKGSWYCQHEEEKILLQLLGEGGVVFDVGARLSGSNTARLIIERGFSGVLVDKAPGAVLELRNVFKDRPDVKVLELEVGIENINDIAPKSIDVCSIDVDSNDWWLWAQLDRNPGVVVIESNDEWRGQKMKGFAPYPSKPKVMPFGATREALVKLGEIKGYELVAQTGVNLIFRRRS